MKKFSELIEARGDTAVFTFCRFNPPTTGHEKLIDALAREQKKNPGAPMYVFPSHSNDPKKNPLPHALKVAYMKKMFRKYAKNITVSKARNVFEVATFLHDKGHKAVVMVVGSDRVDEFDRLLNEYNGVKGRHGYYGFDSISVVSAGERDPDAEGVEGMSASKMRAAAVDGDYDSFKGGLPSGFKDGEKLFKDVRKNMGIREERMMGKLDFYEEMRDDYLTGKIWNVGDIVEANGLTGEIVRKGTNYISFMTEDNKVHKAWLSDIKLDETSLLKRVMTKINQMSHPKTYDKMVKKFVTGMQDKEHKDHPSAWAAEIAREYRISARSLIQYINKLVDKGILPQDLKAEYQTEDNQSFKGLVTMMERLRRVKQDKDVKDEPGTQPAKYYSGVDKSKKDARDAHFKRGASMDDDNPAAYKPAPGDKDAKTKPSKHTKKFKQMFGEKRDAGYPDDSEKIGKKHYIIYKDRRDWYGFEVDKDGNQIGDAIFDPKKGELKKIILRFQEEVEEAPRIPRKKGQPEHEIKVGNYTTKFFHMCGSAQKVMKKNADVEGAEELTRMQDVFYGLEKKVVNSGSATDEQKKKARDMYNKIMQKAKDIGLDDDIGEYMKMHIDSIEKNDPKLGFGRTDLNEKLGKDADVGDYVKDFYKSDAPQFKGKSKKKRRDMAIAAYLSRNETILDKLDKMLTENGHTDVASMKNKVAIAYKALEKMQGELEKLDDEDSLPTWWTNKVATAVSRIDDMADYIDSQVDEAYQLDEKIKGLVKKAEKSGMPYGILKKVYDRGMAAWRTGHRPGTTPQQWAFARVNSFVTKSKGTWGGADKDLAKQVREVSEVEEKKRPTRKDALKSFLSDPRNPKKQAAVQKAFPGARATKSDKDKLRSVLKMEEEKELNEWGEITEKAEYDGRPVDLNNPTKGDKKKYKVYVRNDKGNVVKVEFGDPNMEIKRDDPARRKSFRARHQCDTNPGPKWKARYWSCKFWEKGKTVTDLMKG